MKHPWLLTLFLLMLWLGAANHCFLEALIVDSSNIASAGVGEKCPSHGSGDSQEHREGERCSASVTTEVKKLTLEPYAEVFSLLHVAVFLVNHASEAFLSADITPLVLVIPNTSPSTELLAALVSPNAPPVSLSV